jgi:hypothetical protein
MFVGTPLNAKFGPMDKSFTKKGKKRQLPQSGVMLDRHAPRLRERN